MGWGICWLGSFHPSACCDFLAGFSWVFILLSGVFLSLGVAGLCIIYLYISPSPSEMRLPTMLVSERSASSLCPHVLWPSWGPLSLQGAQHLLPSTSCTIKSVLLPRCLTRCSYRPCCMGEDTCGVHQSAMGHTGAGCLGQQGTCKHSPPC